MPLNVPILSAVGAPIGCSFSWPCHRYDNWAYVENLDDSTVRSDVKFSLNTPKARVNTELSNLAVALSSCTECKTAALAFQINVLTGPPRHVTAENHAVGGIYGCVLCENVALAYQWNVYSNTNLMLTATGRRNLDVIRDHLARLDLGSMGAVTIVATVDHLAAQVESVLSTELIDPATGRRPGGMRPCNVGPVVKQGDDQKGGTAKMSRRDWALGSTQCPL